MRVCQGREVLGGALKKGKWDIYSFARSDKRETTATVLEDFESFRTGTCTIHCRRAK